MQQTQVCLPQFPVQELANRIMHFRKITRLDQQLFMSALLSKDFLSPEEKKLVNEIYQGLNRGWIKAVE